MKLPKRKRLLFLLLLLYVFASATARAGLLIVSNTQNGGPGSLRASVAAAVAGDTIQFNIPTSDPGYDSSTAVFTIRLTSGKIVIDKDLTIAGPTPANIAIGGNHASRIFHVTAGTVDISNLSLINGRAKGADGREGAPSDLAGKPGIGGAVMNEGTLTFRRCTFQGNTAIGGTGFTNEYGDTDTQTFYGSPASEGQGGGIANLGNLTLVHSTLANNKAVGGDSKRGPDGTGLRCGWRRRRTV